ncbi:MAG TPA: hypothetical protein VHM70_00585 [Polyangiaceae bacterium]|nr:hypothetical protein [Polyangiaceae bacterium]
MLESGRIIQALLIVGIACVSACSRKASSEDGLTGAAVSGAAVSGAASAEKATVPVVATAAIAASGNPELLPPRLLAGTGIEVALPKGATRVGRFVAFELPGTTPTLISVAHQITGSNAKEAVERGATVLGAREELLVEGESYALSNAPERMAMFGKSRKDPLGRVVSEQAGVFAAESESSQVVFLRASFPAARRSLVESVASSIRVNPEAALEPLKVYGIEIQAPPGYDFKQHQLHPLVWLPAGQQQAPATGPSLDLRVAGPGQTAALFEELLGMLAGKTPSSECTAALSGIASGSSASTGVSSSGAARQFCEFISLGKDYRVRLDAFSDELGGVVAITRLPLSGAEEAETTLANALNSLRLVTPAPL